MYIYTSYSLLYSPISTATEFRRLRGNRDLVYINLYMVYLPQTGNINDVDALILISDRPNRRIFGNLPAIITYHNIPHHELTL